MSFAWKPSLQTQKSALQSSSHLLHMTKVGLTILMTTVAITVGAPWKLALFETIRMFTSAVCSHCDMLTGQTKCICAHCEGYTHLCMLCNTETRSVCTHGQATQNGPSQWNKEQCVRCMQLKENWIIRRCMW